jgi:hypothetical protein
MSCRFSTKAVSVAVALSLASVAAAPVKAENGRNGAAAAGAIGGFAAGALLGGALAQPRGYVVQPAPPPPVTVYEEVEPACRVIIRREYDPYGYPRRVRTTVCD